MPWPVLATIGTILGAIVGSFLGTVAARLPQGGSVLLAPSACDACRSRLRSFELIPILSWFVQCGRCRHCGARIGGDQLLAELGGALVGAVALGWCLGEGLGWAIAAMVLGWQLLLLALLDARHLWLPRRLVHLLAGSGLVFASWQAWALGDRWHLALTVAMAAGSAMLLAAIAWLYRHFRGREGLGRGDPPLLGAIGLWVGGVVVFDVLLGASLLGLAWAVVLAARGRRIDAGTALPFGTFMALTAWPVFVGPVLLGSVAL